MPKYVKKPIVIEAHVLTKYSLMEICRWMNSIGEWTDNPLELKIPTLEGIMVAKEGDCIIKGIKGEFYPCKPDIFEATYEEVKNEY